MKWLWSKKVCKCCGADVRIMCETQFCGQRCREGECGHQNGVPRG